MNQNSPLMDWFRQLPKLQPVVQISDREMEMAKLEKLCDRLRRERDCHKAERDRLEDEATVTFGKMYRLRRQIDEMTAHITKMREERDTARRENKSLRARIERDCRARVSQPS